MNRDKKKRDFKPEFIGYTYSINFEKRLKDTIWDLLYMIPIEDTEMNPEIYVSSVGVGYTKQFRNFAICLDIEINGVQLDWRKGVRSYRYDDIKDETHEQSNLRTRENCEKNMILEVIEYYEDELNSVLNKET